MQVCDDALSNKIRSLDYSQDLIIVILDQREFEFVLCRIHCNGSWARRTVEAVDILPFDTGEVYRLLEGPNDAIISVECG